MNTIMTPARKAVVLSSGGLDSSTVMAIAKDEGFEIYSLSFFYGQRHHFELTAAEKVAKVMNVIRHLVLNVDLSPIGGSALTDDIAVPKGRDESQMAAEIPFVISTVQYALRDANQALLDLKQSRIDGAGVLLP